MAFFSDCTMKIANREQYKDRMIECPFCGISVKCSNARETLHVCPECGHDIWTLEAGYYGLLELFSEETGGLEPRGSTRGGSNR